MASDQRKQQLRADAREVVDAIVSGRPDKLGRIVGPGEPPADNDRLLRMSEVAIELEIHEQMEAEQAALVERFGEALAEASKRPSEGDQSPDSVST